MAKPQSASEASIEDMLSTIRQAIDEESARADETAQGPSKPPVSGSMREMRVSLQPGGSGGQGTVAARSDDFMAHRPGNEPPVAAKTTVTGGNKPFSGIMGGDVRLEEALSRMHQAEQRQQANQPVQQARADAPTPRTLDEPRLTMPQRPQMTPQPEQAAPPPAPAPQPASVATSASASTQAASMPAGTASHDLEMHGQTRANDPAFVQNRPGIQPEPPKAAQQPAMETPVRPSLTERMEPARPQPQPRPQAPVELEPMPGAVAPTGPDIEAMISEEAMRATSNAFNRLNEEMLLRSMGGEDRLSATVREMIRPMLSAWLDRNLPQMAERLVREEIERVVRRGGR